MCVCVCVCVFARCQNCFWSLLIFIYIGTYCYKPNEILLLRGFILEFSTTNRKLLYKFTKIYTKLVSKLLCLQTFFFIDETF